MLMKLSGMDLSEVEKYRVPYPFGCKNSLCECVDRYRVYKSIGWDITLMMYGEGQMFWWKKAMMDGGREDR